MSPIPDDLMDATAAARLARCHTACLHRWRLKGRVRGWKRCGRWYFSRAEVEGLFTQPGAAPLPPSIPERERRLAATLAELRRRGYRVRTAAEMGL